MKRRNKIGRAERMLSRPDPKPPERNISLTRTQKAFSGPLPPPEVLAEFEKIQTGFADRIVKMAEDEGNHRRSLEKKVVDGRVDHLEGRRSIERSGQIFAFVLALLMIIAAFTLIMYGHPTAGTIFASTTLVGLATAFIYGRRAEHIEKTQKPEPEDPVLGDDDEE